MKSSVIYNARIIDYRTDVYGALFFKGGKIERIQAYSSPDKNEVQKKCADDPLFAGYAEKIDAGMLAVMPAFVDMHAHFRFPGQTEKEDLESGLLAAAAGGFGTLVLMPNTSPVVSSLDSALEINCLAEKIAGQQGAFPAARILQTVSITKDFSGTDISHLDAVCAAAVSAKRNGMYIPVPVITEDGRDVASAQTMFAAMKKCAAAGIIVSCHSEKNSCVPFAKAARADKKFSEAEKILAEAENSATFRNLFLALNAGCNVHIAHVSTKTAIDAVRAAKECAALSFADKPFSVSCEITPHHLGLSCGMPGMECQLVNPPLRNEDDRQALIEALADGTADMIATDHAPHTAADKRSGAPGFSGLETAFAVCNTTLVVPGRISLQKLSALMSHNPALRLGLPCGSFEAGMNADIIIADPDADTTVNPETFFSKGKYSPFAGMTLKGCITASYHNGVCVYKNKA
ncbi:MAG: dihydroorotase [Bacteroides sp.]|nr:dihydroorotase [Prevotella sp.]MCM1407577.1 dihydroorotase [Treponema brennaborense]MCM1469273.1 dihydroorotase [Bacteroides sp.]